MNGMLHSKQVSPPPLEFERKERETVLQVVTETLQNAESERQGGIRILALATAVLLLVIVIALLNLSLTLLRP